MLGSDENRLPQPGDQNSSTLEYLFRQMIETQLKRDKRQEERDEKFQQMLEAQIKRDKRQEERDEKFQQMLEAQIKRDKRQEERDEQWRKEQNERDEKWRKEQEERDNALHGKLDKLTTAIGDLSGKQAEVVPPQPIQQPPADELLEPQPRDIHDPFKTPSKQIKPRPSSLVASSKLMFAASGFLRCETD
ncbi:hypothetical protein BX070DRAFT_99089 [Coemansia spiralis]|nr:hypothetical protein BX070DRAFT_99089 [Coemansia spiralis]